MSLIMSQTTTYTEDTVKVVAEAGVSSSKEPSSTQAKFKIPWPESKSAQRQWQLEQMAGAFRIFAKLGFADGSSGHISLRGRLFMNYSLPAIRRWNIAYRLDADPVAPETFWINPYGVHFGLLTVSDMVQVDEEGNRIGGADKAVNTAGFIIHAAIHKARPDINAACHVHSPYGRAWSNFGRSIDMLNQGRHYYERMLRFLS